MQIIIDNKSGAPIYDQIYTQIKDLIVSGTLREDDPLPSIRALAKDLRISVVTTKRAYEELEREGFIYTVAAKGSFVAAKNMELVREANLRRIEELLEEISRLAAVCGLTGKDLLDMYNYLNEEDAS
ncbi:MAG: GntR family transcriptional regulator [Oscillospiraceae bacterium]|nr:GntR family transcriptional regulator [Oscillospiraceae bacterium]MBR1897306.1 GntR family transcriptional regulator [Oscillospiraceae bacterium]